MSVMPPSSPRSTEASPTPYIPPSHPSQTPSEWGLGSISSYLGTWSPSNTSLFGRCIIWIQGIWQRFLDLFYKSTPTPPPTVTL